MSRSEFNQYRYKHYDRINLANEGLELLNKADPLMGLNRQTIDQSKTFFNEVKTHLNFQLRVLEVLTHRLVRLFNTYQPSLASKFGLDPAIPKTNLSFNVLDAIEELSFHEDRATWKDLFYWMDLFTYSTLHPSQIETKVARKYNLPEISALYYLKIDSGYSRINECEAIIEHALKNFPTEHEKLEEDKGLFYTNQERQWPMGFITLWNTLCIAIEIDLDKLNLDHLFFITEFELAKKEVSLIKDGKSVEEQVKYVFERNKLDLDYYWVPFIPLFNKVLNLQTVINKYLIAASYRVQEQRTGQDFYVRLTSRFVNTLIVLGMHLTDITKKKMPANLTLNRLNISAENAMNTSKVFNQSSGQLSRQLFEQIKKKIDELMNGLSNLGQTAEVKELQEVLDLKRRNMLDGFAQLNNSMSQNVLFGR